MYTEKATVKDQDGNLSRGWHASEMLGYWCYLGDGEHPEPRR